MATDVISLGYFLSIPGPVTFKAGAGKSNMMAEVVRDVSIRHLLLETDSPYLTPVPHRGTRNEPSRIPYIAVKIAELKNMALDEVYRETSRNARDLFGFSAP
jgi:TatD DNase family protein